MASVTKKTEALERRTGMFDEFDGFVGWGEGIRSAEDVDVFDERPDL